MLVCLLQLEALKCHVSSDDVSLLQLQRETVELACMLSLYVGDVIGFERYVSQVKVFYNDYRSLLSDSALQGPVLGLYLLCLLSQNRISDFHTEYELMCHVLSTQSKQSKQSTLSSAFIQFPVLLEQQLMEGCYNQVLISNAALPHPLYAIFMDKLAYTVRTKIADGMELAHHSLSVAEIHKMLRLNDEEETNKFVAKRLLWSMVNKGKEHDQDQDNQVYFNSTKANSSNTEIHALKTVKHTLEYATELERIV